MTARRATAAEFLRHATVAATAADGLPEPVVKPVTHGEWLKLGHEYYWESRWGEPLKDALARYAAHCALYGGERPAVVWLVQNCYRVPR